MAKLTLQVSNPGTASINLTELGTLDWLAFTGNSIPNRKSGANLLTFTFPGTVEGYLASEINEFSWTDGAPTASFTGRAGLTGGRVVGEGFGFTFPADTTERIAEVWASAYGSGSYLEVTISLSDGSATQIVDTSIAYMGGGGNFARYTIAYAAASAGQTLTVDIKVAGEGGLKYPGANGAVLRLPTTDGGGGGGVVDTRVAVPTPSGPGLVVFKVGSGPGQNYANMQALVNALGTLKPLNQGVKMIAEVYKDDVLNNFNFLGLPFDGQDAEHYLTIRPVPGYDAATLNPDTLDYGTTGIELVIDNAIATMSRGVKLEGFRMLFKGSGGLGVGGPNPNGQPTPPLYYTGLERNRIKLTGTATHAIGFGEYNVSGVFRRNLVVRTAGTSDIEFYAVGHLNESNDYVVLNGATGPMVTNSNGYIDTKNNAFHNVGAVPVAGYPGIAEGNYTNMAMTTPADGYTVVTNTPFFVDPTNNFIPATGSPLLGNATDAAKSVLDIRGQNSGLNPDVGAWQRVPSSPLPGGVVTGTMIPSGQQLTINIATTFDPTSGIASLTPALANPGEAIGNTGVLVFDNAADTAVATFSNIAPGNYKATITVSNDGGTASVSGAVPVAILAVGGAPEAPVSGPVTLSPPGKVTNVSAVAGNAKVSVSGTPPFNTGGSPITGFELVASTGQQLSVPSLPADFPLPNNVAATIRVRAINNVGPGALSDPSPSVTPVVPPAKPGAPTIGTAVAKNRAVLVSFTPGSAGDSPITGYIVTGSDGQQTSVTSSPALIAAVNNIPKSYKVRAVSAVGAGPDSASSNTVTPQAIVVVTVKTPAGVPLGGLSGLKWAWFDQPTPDLFTAPTDKGNIEVTAPGTAEMDLILVNSALTSGQVGWLVFTNSDGSPLTNHQAFSGPREVN